MAEPLPTTPLADTGQAENATDLVSQFLGMMQGFQITQAVRVAAKLNLAELLKDQPKTAQQLATATNTNPSALYRLLRLLAAIGILAETPPQQFTLTPLGELLRKDSPNSFYTAALFLGSQQQWQLWFNLLYSVETGESASNHVFGVDTWQYFAQNPEEAENFYGFMTNLSAMLAPTLVSNYDYNAIETIADVGGGQGFLIASILKANPTLKGILFDLPSITKNAAKLLTGQGVAERCQIISGDMFLTWSFRADLYLISRVIHDWDNEKAITILRNCRQVMDANSRVLLVERVIPEDKKTALPVLLTDLQMLIGHGGQERTVEEYKGLAQAASLTLTRVIPIYPPFNIIELKPV
jgi:O-methyltransferase domain/Dimerisation domain